MPAAVGGRLRRLGGDELLAEAVGRADHAGIVDLDAHPLARLPEVEGRAAGRDRRRLDVGAVEVRGVGVGHRARPDHLGRRQRVGVRAHDDRRGPDLGDRQVRRRRDGVAARQRIEVADGARHEHRVADRHAGRRGEDEDALAGGRARVGIGVLDPVAAAAARRADGGDDAGHVGDLLAVVGGEPARVLDVVDAQRAGIAVAGAAAATAHVGGARRRGAGREVAGVVVAVGRVLALHGVGVGRAGRGGRLVEGRRAVADEVDRSGLAGRGVAAGQRRRAVDDGDRPGRARHRAGAGGLRGRGGAACRRCPPPRRRGRSRPGRSSR